jgi:hypothetical protein
VHFAVNCVLGYAALESEKNAWDSIFLWTLLSFSANKGGGDADRRAMRKRKT